MALPTVCKANQPLFRATIISKSRIAYLFQWIFRHGLPFLWTTGLRKRKSGKKLLLHPRNERQACKLFKQSIKINLQISDYFWNIEYILPSQLIFVPRKKLILYPRNERQACSPLLCSKHPFRAMRCICQMYVTCHVLGDYYYVLC